MEQRRGCAGERISGRAARRSRTGAAIDLGRRIQSVFIGGGTPSLLSAAGIDSLLSEIRARLPLTPEVEVTLEANPGAFEAARFKQFRASGVNRLSIGIQSFNDAHLKALGRVHDAQQARRAVEI